jgi:hypothetical protein
VPSFWQAWFGWISVQHERKRHPWLVDTDRSCSYYYTIQPLKMSFSPCNSERREGCGSSFGLWVVFSFSFSPFVRALFAFCIFFASLLFSFVEEEGEAGRREGPKRWWWRAGADNNATTTQRASSTPSQVGHALRDAKTQHFTHVTTSIYKRRK